MKKFAFGKFWLQNSRQNFAKNFVNGGFTLSELLMSVLVVSIILVAMAPVITKRTSDNISTTSVKTQGVMFTVGAVGDGSCYIWDLGGGVLHENGAQRIYQECEFSVPEGVYNINAILVGAGGAGALGQPGYVYIWWTKVE